MNYKEKLREYVGRKGLRAGSGCGMLMSFGDEYLTELLSEIVEVGDDYVIIRDYLDPREYLLPISSLTIAVKK